MDTSKIIKGVVSNGRYTITAPIVKEDYGLYLKIEGVELPETYQVDFSNSENSGTSVTMIGNADGVLIPRQFIDSGKDVFVFLYLVGEDFGRTVYKFRIPNKYRPDRTNEQPTPEEQSVIDQALNALNEAVAHTTQDVIDAEASAQSASADAERAEEARTDAQNYATQAEQSATDAQESASQASASATASANSASQSAQIKSEVEDLADDAQGYAQASAQSASASANSASQASGYAQSASASARSASGYASQADISANTASAKAQDASTSAQTASTKASESAQSASQALTYKTDAESAKTASQTAQGLAESARDSAVQAKTDAESAKADAESARDEAQTIVDGISGALDDKADVITDTASGSIASFTDGADDLPLKSLVVDINPVQDLSQGDPSPTNICPISGWTQVGVNQRGVNLWDEETESGTYSVITGAPRTESSKIRAKNDVPVLPNTTYYKKTPKGFWNIYLDADKNVISYGDAGQGVFTTPNNCYYIRFSLEAAYGTTYNHDISINYPSTDHDYHPYAGRSITIDLGQTVYGGKLDVLSGVLTVYPYYDSYNGETLTGEWISDRDKYVAGTTPTIGAQVVNIGAQGVTVQLEPHEVESLYGVNNIWADSGDTTAEYRANTKLYIERLTAPDSEDMVADANITSGKYFMVGNSLYKATANIANGAQIIVGTNCIRKSLSDALNEINA